MGQKKDLNSFFLLLLISISITAHISSYYLLVSHVLFKVATPRYVPYIIFSFIYDNSCNHCGTKQSQMK